MENYDELKSSWQNQKDAEVPKNGAELVLKTISEIRKKQRIANAVLSTTILVLIAFFFYISAYKYQVAVIGLSTMMGALVFRVILEMISIRKLKRLNPTENALKYKEYLIAYYRNRKIIHFVVTPLVLVVYGFGFWMLLPEFKKSLSEGFYTYIVVSSIVLVFVMVVFIGRKIKEELEILSDLQH